jgi:hypothetical protein
VVDAFQLRRPVDRRVHGPVVTRDTHVPLPRRRDDAQSGGHHDVERTAVCWRGDGGRSTSPRRGTPASLLGSRTFLGMIARLCRMCPSPTPTGPPGLGSSSSSYVILTLIFNICMHFK